MHKVFISYYHKDDQWWKEDLVKFGESKGIFIDKSVDTGDIDENLDDETIRVKIRDEYLKDSTVTIVLVGQKTKTRKHVDWEIYSSMRDGNANPKGRVNRKSGILVVNLPTIGRPSVTAPHKDEKEEVYPEIKHWTNLTSTRALTEKLYPDAPERIIKNIVKPEALVSVTNWSTCYEPEKLKKLIEFAYRDRFKCEYDLSGQLRRRNSS